jgi:arylsulfatase A-like enzyme
MLNKPNIIFILSDQQRWDTMGCYGQKLDITPNLDKMAEKGVLFKNAFTCQPVCGPARSCLQTGKYATETGCYRNNIALPQDEKTIAHWMSEAGYKVGYIGKWHLASTGEESAEKIGPQVNYQTRAIVKQQKILFIKLNYFYNLSILLQEFGVILENK